MASSAIISSQVDLFAFAPQQSQPPAEWLKADPGFWARKPRAGEEDPVASLTRSTLAAVHRDGRLRFWPGFPASL
jgi:hypothetical protein